MIRIREKRLKASENRKKEKLEFEFQTLKNQINPHFLFNSFSTLISMIEENPDIAVEYTEKLSDFFRNILEVKEHELISVDEELEMMQNYFYIQHKRFGKNFSLEISLDEQAKKSKIPPLTLQLLAENAIKHNIVSKSKPLTIKISNSKKFILVSNNLQKKKQSEKSTGVGLQNIKERYRLLTGKEVTIQESQQFFKVILPIIND
jgi:LytS/YehU family sensor histidine kinase